MRKNAKTKAAPSSEPSTGAAPEVLPQLVAVYPVKAGEFYAPGDLIPSDALTPTEVARLLATGIIEVV